MHNKCLLRPETYLQLALLQEQDLARHVVAVVDGHARDEDLGPQHGQNGGNEVLLAAAEDVVGRHHLVTVR